MEREQSVCLQPTDVEANVRTVYGEVLLMAVCCASPFCADRATLFVSLFSDARPCRETSALGKEVTQTTADQIVHEKGRLNRQHIATPKGRGKPAKQGEDRRRRSRRPECG